MPHKDPDVRKAYLREFHRRWYETNKEERQAQIRQYKAANPDRVAEGNKAYRSRPDIKARNTQQKRQWRKANRERDLLNRRLWAKQNRDKLQQYDRRYRVDRTEYNRNYYAANRDRYTQLNRLRYIVTRDGMTAEQFELMKAFAKK